MLPRPDTLATATEFAVEANDTSPLTFPPATLLATAAVPASGTAPTRLAAGISFRCAPLPIK